MGAGRVDVIPNQELDLRFSLLPSGTSASSAVGKCIRKNPIAEEHFEQATRKFSTALTSQHFTPQLVSCNIGVSYKRCDRERVHSGVRPFSPFQK